MSLFTELLERVGTVGEPETTAAAIVADLKLNARQREVLWPIVLEACELVDRNRVRRVEQSVRLGVRSDPGGERAALMLESFALGDGRRVLWGAATIADHEERIAWLVKLADGIEATIDRHRETVATLRSAGVSCLNDLPSDEGDGAGVAA